MANLGALIYKSGIEFLRERMPKEGTVLFQPRAKQDAILKKLKAENPEPLTLERCSFIQHEAQIQLYTKKQYYYLQAASALAFLPFLIFAFFVPSRKKILAAGEKPVAILFFGNRKFVPASLFSEFEVHDSDRGLSLTLKDLLFIFKIWLKKPHWTYFIMKIAYRTATYRHSIQSRVKAFIVSNEYASACSVMTQWCENEKIEHINFQHGASVFNVRDSYATHHRFYAWDEHFLKLFKQMNLRPYRFIVEPPPELFIHTSVTAQNPIPVAKYFLQLNSEEDLMLIAETLKPLSRKFKVIVRPHPRASKSKRLKEIFAGFELENTQVPIADSIGSANFVISRYSTVLLQSIFAGKDTVIDNITEQLFFDRLQELDFYALKLKHILLSDFLKQTPSDS